MLAEQAGFEALWISDHFHPWNDEQGQSPFVWGVIGAISQACRLPVTTAVTAPDGADAPGDRGAGGRDRRRAAGRPVHPRRRHRRGAQRARARRPLADRGRPAGDARGGRRGDARAVGRASFIYHHGRHYTVENARIYTRPESRRRCTSRAFGPKSFDLALRIGDGYITTQPDAEQVERVQGQGRRRQAGAGRLQGLRRGHRGRGRRRSRTGCGPTPACPASCRRCCRRRSTSSRPASWSPRT